MRIKFLILFMLLSGSAFGAITSIDNSFVQNDQYGSDFTDRLNTNFTEILNGGVNNIESANIKDGTILAADMADESSTVIRTKEGASCPFVYSGLLPATSASLSADTSAGTAYPVGVRVVKNAATNHTYTASKWTFVDMDTNGDFHYSEVAFNGATPGVYANSIRLARVSSDGVTINTVTDLRTTSCFNGPFSLWADSTGEATLSDILKNGNGGWENGFKVGLNNSTSLLVQPGTAYINAKFKTLSTATSAAINTLAAPTNSQSGIDTGSVAANSDYYMYAVADQDGVKPPAFVYSLSPTTPSGVTNYRRLAEASTDASATFASADISSISYLGKIVQQKRYETGNVITGTGVVPDDDTIPQNTDAEGTLLMTLPFAPTNAANRLKITVVVHQACNGAGLLSTTLCTNTDANCIASGRVSQTSVDNIMQNTFVHYMTAGTTSVITFKVRAGGQGASTTTFNGYGGARKLGGTLASSITVEEIQQ